MKEQRQRITSPRMGDCFAACMASLLELPLEVLPNDHTDRWWHVWRDFLAQFGLETTYHGSQGAIWACHPWIASVKSKNYSNGTTHAIIMHEGGKVLFDPSTKKRYRKGTYLKGGTVVGGYVITVSDFTLLHKLEEYRRYLDVGKD